MVTESSVGVGRFLGTLDVTIDFPLATVGSRGLANTVDMLLYIVVMLGLAALTTLTVGAFPADAVGIVWLVFLVLAFLLYWGFFAGLEIAMDGQTPGKRLLGLRVVADDGSAATPLSLLLRNLARIIDWLPAIYGIGVPLMMLHPQGKRLGDLLGGTIVVREPQRPPVRVPRRWPSRFEADEIALLEAYFERESSLTPEHREALAREIFAWISKRAPDLTNGADLDAAASHRLHRIFPAERTAPSSPEWRS